MPNTPQTNSIAAPGSPYASGPLAHSAPSAWFDELVSETAKLEQLGVHAAMLAVRLRVPHDTVRAAAQARTLFGLILRPTDRVDQTTPVSFSILLAPQSDLAETVRLSHRIANALTKANIEAATGFAQRRPQESLLDTWARAEAELDRAAYRVEHPNGLTIS